MAEVGVETQEISVVQIPAHAKRNSRFSKKCRFFNALDVICAKIVDCSG